MYSYRVYTKTYIGDVFEEMFLFKVGFTSLIKILSWISSLKLCELLARIEKSSWQTAAIQKNMWSCMAEVWELFLTNFPVSGETPICSEVHVLLCRLVLLMYSALQPLHLKL